MEKSIILFFFVGLFGILSATDRIDECPKPTVRKRTIIRSSSSIKNGAILLQKLNVDSARNCYTACCNTHDCNVGVMHYKQEVTEEGDEVITKFCFLFDCKSPSICTFDEHNRYAIIEIPKIQSPIQKVSTSAPTTTSTIAPTTTSTIAPTTLLSSKSPSSSSAESIPHEKCAPGVPVSMCAENPCIAKSCALNRDAVCKPSFCGGCYAKFYDTAGTEVKCTKEVLVNSVDGHNEEVAEINYVETPNEALLGPVHHSKKDQTNEDPYFSSDRRGWVDGKNTGDLTNATVPNRKTEAPSIEILPGENKIIVVNNSLMSVPLLIALLISITLIIGLIYRFKCAPKGKPKKFPVDDGDYLINGMYL